MCGIAGLVRLNGDSVDQQQLDRLTDGVLHRGPEGRGTFMRGNVGLGHRRLKIIDLSEASAQPMVSEDGRYVMVFNGEIYNFQDERARLQSLGHTFRSTGDSEVLLRLYVQHGVDCLQYLRGMFALAIYDTHTRTIFLARDRLGKKPLKYFHQNGVFAFASELKALRTLPECPAGADADALYHFLTMMYVPAPHTGLSGIRKLPAAHYALIHCDTGAMEIKRYWQLDYTPDVVTSLPEWKEKIGTLMREAVRLRMIADVPVGAFLSGGLDSGTVVALMSALSGTPVKTFSIGSDDPAFNELPDAERLARHCGTDHHPIPLNADMVTLLPSLVHTYEEPYADPSSIPTYLVAQATRAHVTVALNGDGGDENFAGYVRYPILRFSHTWSHAPLVHPFARLLTGTMHRALRSTLSYRMKRFEDSVGASWPQRYLQYLSFFTEEEKKQLLTPSFLQGRLPTPIFYEERTASSRERGGDLVAQAMSMDVDTYLADDLLPKVDLGAMAHALEARSPLLDHVLLECTAHLPTEYKLRGRTRKWIMRELMADLLPPDLITRPKRGFRLPLDRWFRDSLRPFVDDRLLGHDPKFHAIVDRVALEQFLRRYNEENVDLSDHVWALLWLQEWLHQYT